MSISYAGFERENIETIIERLVGQLLDAKPDISITPDNPIYQLIKISASEILRMQIILEEQYKNMSIVGANGTWLDMHGIECGVGRRKANYATGVVKMIGASNVDIPIETFFNTSENVNFLSYEANYIPAYETTFKNDANGYDIPLPMYDAVVDYIRTDPADDETSMNPALWYMEDDHITFRDPDTDFTYLLPSYDESSNTMEYLQDTMPTTEPSDAEQWIPTAEDNAFSNLIKYVLSSGSWDAGTPLVQSEVFTSGTIEYMYFNNTLYNVDSTTAIAVLGGRIDEIPGTPTDGWNYYANVNMNHTSSFGPVYQLIKDHVYVYESTDDSFTDIGANINASVIDITGDEDYLYVDGWQTIATTSGTYTITDTMYGLGDGTYVLNNPSELWHFTINKIYEYSTTTDLWTSVTPTTFNKIHFNSETYVFYNDEWTVYLDIADSSTIYIIYGYGCSFDIDVRAEYVGNDGNTAAFTINECSSFPTYITTNVLPVINGLNTETDEVFRERLLKVRRGNFNAWSINRKLLETKSIRLVKTYQAYGTDIAEMKSGGLWDTTNWYTTYAGDTYGFTNHYGFTFYPSEGIATLKGVTLHGSFKGEPDDLEVRLYKATYDTDTDIDYTALDSSYIRRVYISTKDLEEQPASLGIESAAQEIFAVMDYPKMENSTTYTVVIMGSANDDATNYWKIYYGSKDLTGESIYWRNYAYEDSAFAGTFPANNHMYVKTHHGVNAFNIAYVAHDGYTDEDVLNDIEKSIDTEGGYGFQPVGNIRNSFAADKAYINITTNIVVDIRFNPELVKAQLIINLDLYLDNLDIGDNVSYSQIEFNILNTDGIVKAYDTKISLNDKDYIETNESQDIVIQNEDYAYLNINAEGEWEATGNKLKGVIITVI